MGSGGLFQSDGKGYEMALTLSLTCDESCFELPDWRELLMRDPDRHVFSTPEWNRAWWEEFGRGKDLFILTLTRGDDLAALVPLYRKHEDDRKLLRFIGGISLTDYLGPICSLEDRADVADTLVDWLGDADVEWDEFDAHNMPVPFGFAEFLVESADRRGFEFTLLQEETSAVLQLPSTWDDYLRLLRSKERHELRRKRRRFENEHGEPRLRTSTEETLEQDLKLFVEMHRGAEGHKGHFMRPEIATFFERVAHAFMPLDWLRLDLLEVGDQVVASTFAFEYNGSFYLYNSAYEPEIARSSPGLMLVSELVRKSIEQGLKRFDFLRGPERYKYQLGAQPLPLHNVRVLNRRAG